MLRYHNTRHFLRTYAALLGMTLVAFLVRLVKLHQFTLNQHIAIQLVSMVVVVVMWETLRFINYKLNVLYPYERSISGRITVQLVLGASVGVGVRLIIYLFGEPRLSFHLDELFLAATWALYILVSIGINLAFIADYFINRWKDSLVLAERLEKEKAQVQFDNLKNQLNPHFLFNALTSLNSLIFENQGLASQFLQHMSKVYRYVLQNKEKNFVTLETELDFIQNYVFLLETRFKNAVRIRFDVREETKEKAIVPVTLQILIENALKHNVTDLERPLQIDITTIGDYLVVSNNLQLRNLVETSNKQGLENLRSLYQFLTERPVLVESSEDRFYVKVPLI